MTQEHKNIKYLEYNEMVIKVDGNKELGVNILESVKC